MAKLYFKYGAMNSGKSTLLLQSAHNYEERGMRTIILKPMVDTKGDDKIVSRLGVTRKVDYLVKAEDSIDTIVDRDITASGSLHCIFVDECQFLTVKQAEELFWIAVSMDIPVLCYGLRTDFLTNDFAAFLHNKIKFFNECRIITQLIQHIMFQTSRTVHIPESFSYKIFNISIFFFSF